MDPITTVLLNSLVSRDVIDITKLLFERLTAAKEEYKEKSELEKQSPIEVRRQSLILRLCSVQSNLLLTVYDQRFLERVLPLLVDQTISVYEAHSEQELAVLEMNLGQIEGVLGQYNQRMKARARARKAAIIVSFLAMVGLFVLVIIGPRYGLSVDTMIPILAIPLPVILWSTIGSFTAILYRFNNSGDIELQDPLRWLFTRPLTGIMVGIITFFIIKAGLLTLAPESTTPALGSKELMWLAAFLVGFSDRFSDTLLRSLVGRFGGDKNADLVTIQSLSAEPALPYVNNVLDGISTFIRPRRSSLATVATITQSKAPITEELVPTLKQIPQPLPLPVEPENNAVEAKEIQKEDGDFKQTIQ
jgi:hypothetical protein